MGEVCKVINLPSWELPKFKAFPFINIFSLFLVILLLLTGGSPLFSGTSSAKEVAKLAVVSLSNKDFGKLFDLLADESSIRIDQDASKKAFRKKRKALKLPKSKKVAVKKIYGQWLPADGYEKEFERQRNVKKQLKALRKKNKLMHSKQSFIKFANKAWNSKTYAALLEKLSAVKNEAPKEKDTRPGQKVFSFKSSDLEIIVTKNNSNWKLLEFSNIK